jgi:hypothetical protein
MGKGLFVYRRRKNAGLTEKAIVAGAPIAGGKASPRVKEGKYRQALSWAVPLVFAGMAFWYIRKGSRRSHCREFRT